MALLAYSIRRAAGAVAVLLVVTWLIQFAVSHFDAPPKKVDCLRCVPPAIEDRLRELIFPISAYQPDLAREWNAAALMVGLAMVTFLISATIWRLRGQRRA